MKISILVIAQQQLSRIVLRNLHRRRDMVELRLERALQRASLLNSNLSDSELLMKIDSFKKFVILRHPLDRLVSGFRDKLGAPLVKKLSRYNYFEELKHAILLKFHPNSYQVWKMSESEQKLYLPFSTFIRWLVDSNEGDLNEHFQTQLTVSQPCLVHYNFYGDFRRFTEDGLQILNQFTSDVSAFDREGNHSHKMTRLLLNLYYSQLEPKLKKALWRRWKNELEFYHLLYPDDQSLTETLLGQHLQNRWNFYHMKKLLFYHFLCLLTVMPTAEMLTMHAFGINNSAFWHKLKNQHPSQHWKRMLWLPFILSCMPLLAVCKLHCRPLTIVVHRTARKLCGNCAHMHNNGAE